MYVASWSQITSTYGSGRCHGYCADNVAIFIGIILWLITNDEVFQRAKEESSLLKLLKNRRHSWIGLIIWHNAFVVNVSEGEISGKKAVGRPRLQNLKQDAKNTGADSYTAMKRIACNNSRWKAANQLDDLRIRRRRRSYVFAQNLYVCSAPISWRY